jgi:3-hydroxyisobutyrate dehydrogenase
MDDPNDPQPGMPTVGLVGLGAMGIEVASNLLKKGFPVVGYDVRGAAYARFEAEGGHRANSPAEVGRQASVVIVFTVNAAQAESVLAGSDGILAAMGGSGVVALCCTALPEDVKRLGAMAAEQGVSLLDSPVSGGTAGAAAGTLTIMAAGPKDAYENTQPVFEAFGANLYHLGEEWGLGSTMKMVNQLLVGVHIAAACEAVAFGARAGIDPALLFEIVGKSAGSSWAFKDRVPRILAADYAPPRSAVNIFVKDLGIVLDTARGMTFPLPLAGSAYQQFVAASAAGWGNEDDSSVVRLYQRIADIPLPKKD